MNAHCLLRDYVRAQEIAPYGDDCLVRSVTRMLVDHGHTILQSHKLGATDNDHVLALLGYFKPPILSHVLDVGCGVGEVARIMAMFRPDLRFTLTNISGAQLEMAPAGMDKVRADMHALPFCPSSFDAVMFNYSLGHGLLDQCFAEAARVLRPGGILFVYDLATEDHEYLIEHLGYRPHSLREVMETAERHDLFMGDIDEPDGSTDDFIRLIGSEAFVSLGFNRAFPMVYRFTKEPA